MLGYYLKTDGVLSMSMENYYHFKHICQARGFKATSQRYVIFQTLLSRYDHPTADHLFELVAPSLPGLSRDTVYRTVNLLAEHGLAKKLAIAGEATRFDANLSPHHHFICEICGLLYDIPWPEFDALPWPKAAFSLGNPRQVTVYISGQGPCCHGGQPEICSV